MQSVAEAHSTGRKCQCSKKTRAQGARELRGLTPAHSNPLTEERLMQVLRGAQAQRASAVQSWLSHGLCVLLRTWERMANEPMPAAKKEKLSLVQWNLALNTYFRSERYHAPQQASMPEHLRHTEVHSSTPHNMQAHHTLTRTVE